MKPVRVRTSWTDGHYTLHEDDRPNTYDYTWTEVPWWQWRLYRAYLWLSTFAWRFERKTDDAAWAAMINRETIANKIARVEMIEKITREEREKQRETDGGFDK